MVRAGARRRRVRRDRPARRRGPPDPRDRYPARCPGVLNRLRSRVERFRHRAHREIHRRLPRRMAPAAVRLDPLQVHAEGGRGWARRRVLRGERLQLPAPGHGDQRRGRAPPRSQRTRAAAVLHRRGRHPTPNRLRRRTPGPELTVADGRAGTDERSREAARVVRRGGQRALVRRVSLF